MKLCNVWFVSIVSFFALNIGFAENRPIFDQGELSIPIADSPSMLGAYQDITFEYTEQSGWQLLEFKNGRPLDSIIDGELTPGIKSVEIIQTDSFPVQIFLEVTARLRTECEDLGHISSELTGVKFEIFIFYANNNSGCASVGGPVPFINKIIPLDVYSLKSGEYEYRVNGSFTGAFSLVKDNEF